MNSPGHFFEAIKTGVTRASLVFALCAVPTFGIKWGVSHRGFDWSRFFQKASAVHFSPDSAIWSNSFSIEMPWQEKAALVICTFFAAYIFFQLRLNINAGEENFKTKLNFWQRPEQLFKYGSHAFLFLYVAACALCERTGLGVLPVEYSIASLYRDFGLATLVTTMLFLSRYLIKQASFNGMLTRDDSARAFNYLVAAIAGLAMCFATWLPFFALPGALIMIRFSLQRIKEIDDTRSQTETPEYANCDEADP